MNRNVAAIAVAVFALGLTVTAPAAADVAARTPIRTYAAQISVYTKGVGSQQGWFTSQAYTEGVVLAPHVALTEKTVFDYGWNDHHRSTQLYYIVGTRSYTKNGNGPWSVQRLSSSALRGAAQSLNPYQTQKEFLALPGVMRASGTRYQVTGNYAQVGSFLLWAFSLPQVSFGGTNLKVFTISFWDGSHGRPAKIAVSARSATFAFTATETFTSYNKPLTITAP
ncbi:MAG: hypothetical protein JO345_16355 [Streptosporangiaceae bacterium]|nr:hypothetical protein [Streptosporangiaceae bacterium]